MIAKRTLRGFWEKHRDSEQRLKAWYKEVVKSKWKTPGDMQRKYRTASFLENNRVCFNIKGNSYRLVISINYDYGFVWIRFIGTHSEYDNIDGNTI